METALWDYAHIPKRSWAFNRQQDSYDEAILRADGIAWCSWDEGPLGGAHSGMLQDYHDFIARGPRWRPEDFTGDDAPVDRQYERRIPAEIAAAIRDYLLLNRTPLPPPNTDWAGALQRLLGNAGPFYYMPGLDLLPIAECRTWTPMASPDATLYPWDAPMFADGTMVQMDGGYGSYLNCFARIDWKQSRLYLTRQDEKTEAMNGGGFFLIYGEDMVLLKRTLWPGSTRNSAWF